MNSKQIIDFIKQPDKLQKPEAEELQRALDEYPYSGVLHALYLKALKNQNNYLYPKQLKRTAIAVPDRKQLYFWAEALTEAPERELPKIIFKAQTQTKEAKPEQPVVQPVMTPQISKEKEPQKQEVPIAAPKPVPAPVPKQAATSQKVEAKPTTSADINLDHLPASVRETILRARRVHEKYGKKYDSKQESDTKPVASEAPAVQPVVVPSVESEHALHQNPEPQVVPESIPETGITASAHIVPAEEDAQPRAVNAVEKEEALITTKEASPGAEEASEGQKSSAEKLSFTDWLQNSSFDASHSPQVQKQETTAKPPQDVVEDAPSTEKVQQLYEEFMEKKAKSKTDLVAKDQVDTASLGTSDYAQYITETLAQVYVQQKLYDRALNAYEILRLKYPEKSSFFAARITEIKQLRNENN